jgi:hypothetical protein
MAVQEQFTVGDDFDPSLDPSLDPFLDPFLDPNLPEMSLDSQGNNWNQFEYEWRTLMNPNPSDQSVAWNSSPPEDLNTEYLSGPQPITSWQADPDTGFEDSFEDMFYLPPESTQISPLSASNDPYSQDSSFTSGSPQQNSLSPSDTMAPTSPSAPPSAFYTCDTCAKKFEKKSVLKFVSHFLHKFSPPFIPDL